MRAGPLLLPLFFLSGFTGLVYETLWQKQMIVLLGASAPAITAVLGAFFAGIALGGRAGDAILARARRPALALYGAAELVVAANALAMPLLQRGLHNAYLALAHGIGATSPAAYAFRFLATMLTILPATLAMGATIPFMAEALRRRARDAVAVAYGVNALGAMLGALAGPVLLVPAFGIRGALAAALSLNAAVAATAWLAARREAPRAAGAASPPPAAAGGGADPGVSWRLAYFAAGAVALGAETTWLRILALQTTNGTLLFAVTLAVFLGAYAVGSLAVHPLLARATGARAQAAWVQIAVAAALLATLPLIRRTPSLLSAWILEPLAAGTFRAASVPLFELSAVASAVLLPALAMGIVFPAMARATAACGGLYFWGNLGSLAGALLFGLVLVPAAGLTGSLMLLVMSSAAIGLWLLPRDRRVQAAFVACTAGAALLWHGLPPFTKQAVRLERRPGGVFAESGAAAGPGLLLRYREGQSATVLVREVPGAPGARPVRRIYVDEQLVASTDPDAVVDSKMLAHLPALLHPAPRRALSVGYGGGGTSWSLALHGLEARTVEIEREVLRAAPLFVYGEVWQRPNFRAILNDARDHLQTTDERYDFISTDVTNLQYKQNSSLYTAEYFALMKSRLTPDGIACAWIPMSAISPREFQILLRTFQAAYPHATLWLMNEVPTYFGILIGTPGPLSVDFDRVGRGMAREAVAADLRQIGIESPLQIGAALLLDADGMRAFTAGAPLHTDDDPVLEHHAPYSFYRYMHHFAENLEGALRHRPAAPGPAFVGLDAAQATEFAAVWRASRHWYEVMAAQARLKLERDPAARRTWARAALAAAEAAAREHPGWRTWRQWQGSLGRVVAPLAHGTEPARGGLAD